MNEDLRQVANEHWRIFYRNLVESLGGEWRRFGAADAFSTPNTPAPFANGVLVIEPAQGADVERAIEWVLEQGVPFRARIDASLGGDVLDAPLRAGLARSDWTMPGMVLEPVPAAPAPAPGVTVERVVAANFDDFIDANVESGFPRQVARIAFNLEATGDDLDFFLARLDGRPAGTSTLVRTSADVAGIYAVATVERARRRGVGSAVTWAAVERAREWGCRLVVLQSSEMGLRVYQQIGFRTVVEYALFVTSAGQGQVTQ